MSVWSTTDIMTTISTSHSTAPLWIGYIAVVITVFFFGSNLLPARKYPIGDSFSFQFFMCCGIWITGLIIDLFVSKEGHGPPLFSLVLIGGALWATGNILCLLVIRINGIGLSMLLWCTTNLLVGWASGHFGWFGLKPEDVEKPALNYIGVVIACLSGVVFFAVRPVKQKEIIKDQDGNEPFIESSQGATIKTVNGTSVEKAPVTIVKTVSIQQRIVGAILAIITGAIFGLVFNPSTYIQDHLHKYPGATKNGLHYVYAMYSGILISSIFYYVVYIAYKRNHPYLCIQSILPAIISGMMWGVAQAGFLVANSVLSQAISFPLIMIGPGTIATLWSIFYFKEITGIRNYLIIIAGTILRIIAAVLIVLSKPVIKD